MEFHKRQLVLFCCGFVIASSWIGKANQHRCWSLDFVRKQIDFYCRRKTLLAINGTQTWAIINSMVIAVNHCTPWPVHGKDFMVIRYDSSIHTPILVFYLGHMGVATNKLNISIRSVMFCCFHFDQIMPKLQRFSYFSVPMFCFCFTCYQLLIWRQYCVQNGSVPLC